MTGKSLWERFGLASTAGPEAAAEVPPEAQAFERKCQDVATNATSPEQAAVLELVLALL